MLRRFSRGKTSQWSLSRDVVGLADYMQSAVPEGQLDLVMWNVLGGLSEAIDPFLDITANDPFFNAQFEMFPAASPDVIALSFVLTAVDRNDPVIDWDELNRTPEAVKFHISHRWIRTGEGGEFIPGNANELARVIIPSNETGLIKSIQTEVTFGENDLRWPRGDSAWHERNLGVNIGVLDLRWAVKIESLENNARPNAFAFRNQTIVVPANWLAETPGTVHPEIAPWDKMIFLLGYDHYVRLRCPPNSLISLWVYFAGPALNHGAFGCSAIVKGQSQILRSCRTFRNMTEMD